MPNSKPTIGKLLKQFSLDSGISQQQIGDRLGYSKQRVNNYFRDIVVAPKEFLTKFKEEFGVDIELLLKKQKTIEAFPKAYNPIPVFDLEAKPIKEPDFFNYSEFVSYYIDVPMFNDCSAAIRVATSAMQPDLNPNDVVTLKRITNFDAIMYGGVFFVICEENRFVRYIKRNEDNPQKTVLLTAADSHFDAVTLKKTDIKYLFQVMGRITRFNI
jgi:transcriptional regulator with XRE-family HTH domain